MSLLVSNASQRVSRLSRSQSNAYLPSQQQQVYNQCPCAYNPQPLPVYSRSLSVQSLAPRSVQALSVQQQQSPRLPTVVSSVQPAVSVQACGLPSRQQTVVSSVQQAVSVQACGLSSRQQTVVSSAQPPVSVQACGLPSRQPTVVSVRATPATFSVRQTSNGSLSVKAVPSQQEVVVSRQTPVVNSAEFSFTTPGLSRVQTQQLQQQTPVQVVQSRVRSLAPLSRVRSSSAVPLSAQELVTSRISRAGTQLVPVSRLGTVRSQQVVNVADLPATPRPPTLLTVQRGTPLVQTRLSATRLTSLPQSQQQLVAPSPSLTTVSSIRATPQTVFSSASAAAAAAASASASAAPLVTRLSTRRSKSQTPVVFTSEPTSQLVASSRQATRVSAALQPASAVQVVQSSTPLFTAASVRPQSVRPLTTQVSVRPLSVRPPTLALSASAALAASATPALSVRQQSATPVVVSATPALSVRQQSATPVFVSATPALSVRQQSATPVVVSATPALSVRPQTATPAAQTVVLSQSAAQAPTPAPSATLSARALSALALQSRQSARLTLSQAQQLVAAASGSASVPASAAVVSRQLTSQRSRQTPAPVSTVVTAASSARLLPTARSASHLSLAAPAQSVRLSSRSSSRALSVLPPQTVRSASRGTRLSTRRSSSLVSLRRGTPVEEALLRAENPLEFANANEEVEVNNVRGRLLNKSELANWQGELPLDQYEINQDPNPEVVRKRPTGRVQYKQNIAIRYLKPPTPQRPGDIIIREEPGRQIAAAPPVVLRQVPPSPRTPTPLVIREAPPAPPTPVGAKIVTIQGKLLPPPPRKVVLERLPEQPEKPRSILIEKWLPYRRQPRRVIYEKPCPNACPVPPPRNIVIEWEKPDVEITHEIKEEGVVRADPAEYVRRYGNELVGSQDIPQLVAQNNGPANLRLESRAQSSSRLSRRSQAGSRQPTPVLVGEVEALRLIQNLSQVGLSQYQQLLN